jgi:hypothetical protein
MHRIVFALLLLGACGRGVANVDVIGDGTETLLVFADADFQGNQTRIEVQVIRGGAVLDINQATVQIGLGEDGALQNLVDFNGDTFRLDLNGYARELHLVVTAGADNLDAVFEGPSPALIEAPEIFAISEGEDVRIEWDSQDGDGATEVEVSTDGFRATLLGDPGDIVIPFFNVDPDADSVTVERINVAALGGGLEGSFIRISAETDAGLQVN